MLLSDSRNIRAEPAIVWQAILNPEVLKECIPGCESLEMTSPTAWRVTKDTNSVGQRVFHTEGKMRSRFGETLLPPYGVALSLDGVAFLSVFTNSAGAELAELERHFLERVAQTNKCKGGVVQAMLGVGVGMGGGVMAARPTLGR